MRKESRVPVSILHDLWTTYDTGSHDELLFFFNRIQHLFDKRYYFIYIYMYLRAVITIQFLYH